MKEDPQMIEARAEQLADRIESLITEARKKVAVAANTAMVYAYYEIGRYIVEDEQGGKARAEYGKGILKSVSARLTLHLGKGWSVDTLDWKTRNKYSVKNEILSHSRDGSIVLLHDLYKTSVDAVLEAIDELKQEGYVFVTVDELLTRYGYPISNMAHFSQYSVTSTVVIDKHESDTDTQTDTNSEIQTDSEISTDTDTGTDTEIKTDTDTAGEDTNAETETDIDTGTDIPDSTDTELLTGTDE